MEMPGDRIKKLRKVLKMPARELAELIRYERTSLTNAENRLNPPPDRMLYLISDATGASFDWLKTGEGAMFAANDVANREKKTLNNALEKSATEEQRKKILSLLSRISNDDLRILLRIARKVVDECEKD